MRRPELIASLSVLLYIVFFAVSPPPVVQSVLANPVGMAAAVGGAIYVTLYKSKVVGGLLLVALVLSMSRGGREGLTSCAVGNAVASKKWNYTGTPLLTAPSPNIDSCGRACCGSRRCKNYMYNSDSKSCTLLSDAQTTGPMVTVTGPEAPKMFAGSVTQPSEALPPPGSGSGSGTSTTSGSGAGSGTSTTSGSGTGSGTSTTSGSGTGSGTSTTSGSGAGSGTSTTPPPPPSSTPTPSSSGAGAGSGTSATSVNPIMSCNVENYSNFKRSGPQDFAPF